MLTKYRHTSLTAEKSRVMDAQRVGKERRENTDFKPISDSWREISQIKHRTSK